jgi:hypothetical protein
MPIAVPAPQGIIAQKLAHTPIRQFILMLLSQRQTQMVPYAVAALALVEELRVVATVLIQIRRQFVLVDFCAH